MADPNLYHENRDLRLKLQAALRRAAEAETNLELQKKLQVGADALDDKAKKKVDQGKSYV